MPADLRALFETDPDTLLREAIGLSALMVAILAAFFLPALA